MEIRAILAEALNGAQRAESITPRSHLELSALRWELYATFQNILDAMAMMVVELGLRKPPSYAGLGHVLREEGLLEERHVEAVRTLASTGNALAHAYRRLGGEDLKAIVDKVLPCARELIGRLLEALEGKGVDPLEMSPSLTENVRRAFAEHDVAVAYLFGSRARGAERVESDYDIAVLFRAEDVTVLDEVELAKELASTLGVPVDRVDVVALNRADRGLMARVLREGIPPYCRSEEEKRRWELETYLNLLKCMDLDALYITRTIKRFGEKKGDEGGR